MNYEKKYKEALETARKLNSGEGVASPPGWTVCEVIFPELRDSEDERIRKELLESFKYQQRESRTDKEWLNGIKLSEVVAWLEKQGEQKPIDKVEPKFNVGDWVVYKNDICQIVKREEGSNKLVTVFGIEKELVNERNLSTAHLWTIKDAKDGDVLASKDKLDILIFRNLDTSINFSSYYNIAGKGELDWSNDYFIPATKEQRDHLFEKMKEAGYEWDEDKKELKKIEKQEKPKWTEEDIIRLDRICKTLWKNRKGDTDEIYQQEQDVDWLKALKQRMEE